MMWRVSGFLGLMGGRMDERQCPVAPGTAQRVSGILGLIGGRMDERQCPVAPRIQKMLNVYRKIVDFVLKNGKKNDHVFGPRPNSHRSSM